MNDEEYYKSLRLRPACDGMSRREVTSRLNKELVRCRLDRRNAYAYWAHEVEVWDERKQSYDRIDFVQYEPFGYHTATAPALVDKGTFTVYEVKSCLADCKSGHGTGFIGDLNYLVMPVETYPRFLAAWNGTAGNMFQDFDRELRKCFDDTTTGWKFLLYGRKNNGTNGFAEAGSDILCNHSRRKPASELLMCMMRAMIANSGHSDVDHVVGRGGDDMADVLRDAVALLDECARKKTYPTHGCVRPILDRARALGVTA